MPGRGVALCPGATRIKNMMRSKRDRRIKVRRNRASLSLIKRVRMIRLYRRTQVTVRVTQPRTIGILTRWQGRGPRITECSLRPGRRRPLHCDRPWAPADGGRERARRITPLRGGLRARAAKPRSEGRAGYSRRQFDGPAMYSAWETRFAGWSLTNPLRRGKFRGATF